MNSKMPECKKGFIHHDLCSCRNDLIAERDQLKLRAEALDAKCDAQAKEIEWLKKFEGWDQNRIDEIASDRDSWKARAERMEKALKEIMGSHQLMCGIGEYCPRCRARKALTETEGK